MSAVCDGRWGRPLLHGVSAVDCPPTHLPITSPLGQKKDGRGMRENEEKIFRSENKSGGAEQKMGGEGEQSGGG